MHLTWAKSNRWHKIVHAAEKLRTHGATRRDDDDCMGMGLKEKNVYIITYRIYIFHPKNTSNTKVLNPAKIPKREVKKRRGMSFEERKE